MYTLYSSVFVCLCRSLLFSRKSPSGPINTDGASSVPGWKLFGKIPPKQAPEKDLSEISHEYGQTRRLDTGKPEHESSFKPINPSTLRGQIARRSDKEVPSTTALILEHRPEFVFSLY